jgi:hypothetical protein
MSIHVSELRRQLTQDARGGLADLGKPSAGELKQLLEDVTGLTDLRHTIRELTVGPARDLLKVTRELRNPEPLKLDIDDLIGVRFRDQIGVNDPE